MRWSRRVETIDHQELKWLACEWLIRQGARVVATEVSAPIPRWRVDVAGWLDGRDHRFHRPELDAPLFESAAAGHEPIMTIAVECKQSRADFASDDADPGELAKRKAYLLERRRVIEELRVKVRETHLKVEGSSLFEELATWEFGESRIAAYRRVLDELAAIDGKLGIDTKFAQLARWRTADHLIVMTPSGLLRPREVPSGWGLVEVDPKALRKGWEPVAGDPLPCTTRVTASSLATPSARRQRLLRNLAVAACRGVGYGLTPPRPVPTTSEAAASPPAPTEPSLFSPGPPTAADTMNRHEPR